MSLIETFQWSCDKCDYHTLCSTKSKMKMIERLHDKKCPKTGQTFYPKLPVLRTVTGMNIWDAKFKAHWEETF